MVPKINKLIHQQVKKFNFRSSILRDLIVHQIKQSNGKAASLNTCRHYINSKGVQPYEELYEPIRRAVQAYCDKNFPKEKRALKFHKMNNIAHEVYKNKINEKIYAYTLKTLYRELKV